MKEIRKDEFLLLFFFSSLRVKQLCLMAENENEKVKLLVNSCFSKVDGIVF